ncbi:LLM class flavin-dependent oxidoreductase [Pseudonocardia xinjiangensis]|uniref:LLM class flavin-dependent oxidoreductase n=1 Tax=Pseudonocardia xinjiangensis TaxID=75289 RepID=A0ABX1RPJ5_9PSEU|nr:LLM class flavin-dependent oxidoreductase [Pseudonocardia xinjiangensis]NMH82307.1 LLM class flavin-dependent oxidoreductase [Pseudonocardia xinjiangensis]
MSDRAFRFGVVATPTGGPDEWIASARRAEELGYSSLLMPDGLQLLAPFPSLAVAASATKDLRVGTFVLASPLRPPRSAAWEGHSLSVLTGGRFEFGIGTGRPAVREFTESLGVPFGTAAERLQQVADSIDHLRELDGTERRTPVLVAAGGPKALAVAADKADIVTLAAAPLASRDELAGMVRTLRNAAGDRADAIELAMNLFVVGTEVPPWTQSFVGADAATLIEHDSLVMLRGSTTEMADELQRRRDALGVSYISVNGAFFEQLAPVVERLAGR